MLLCHITTQVEGDKHQTLLRDKGGRGFPHLVFLDAEGNVLATQGDRSVAGFRKTQAAIGAYDALSKKLAAGDKAVAADLLLAGIDLGKVKFEEAKATAGGLGKLNAETQKKVDVALLNLEVADAMSTVRSQEAAIEAGKKFATMLDAGRVPEGNAARNFFMMILQAKEAEKDAAGYEKALNSLKKAFGDDQRMKRAIEQADAKLKQLKGEG